MKAIHDFLWKCLFAHSHVDGRAFKYTKPRLFSIYIKIFKLCAQNAKIDPAKLEIWPLICPFTLGRIPTLVHSAKSHSDKLENWWSTYSSTVGKTHTVELQSAKSHSAKLEPWADICLCTLGKSPTLVPSVKNHWLKWRSEEPYAQCSPTVERSRTYMHRV